MHPVLIDTDIAIDYLKGVQYAKELIDLLWDSDMAYFSVLSVYELWAGMRENEKEDTSNFIKACIIENITSEIAVKGGELYKHYRAKGITLTSIDCLVAATAIINGHKIATRNTAHYPEKGLLLKFKA